MAQPLTGTSVSAPTSMPEELDGLVWHVGGLVRVADSVAEQSRDELGEERGVLRDTRRSLIAEELLRQLELFVLLHGGL